VGEETQNDYTRLPKRVQSLFETFQTFQTMHVHKQIVYLSIRNDINSYYKIKGKTALG